MARLDDTAQILTAQNGKKTLIAKITVSTTGTRTNLPANVPTIYGTPAYPIPAGAQLMLQSDQDFFYNLCPAGATSAVTNYAGASPGTRVSATQQEFVHLKGTGRENPASLSVDGALDIVAIAAGTLAVFLVE